MFMLHLYPQNLETRILNPLLGQEFRYENPPFFNIPITISKTSFAIMRSLLRATKPWTHIRVRRFLFWLHSANSPKSQEGKSLLLKNEDPRTHPRFWFIMPWGGARESAGVTCTKAILIPQWSYRQLLREVGLSPDVYFVNRHFMNEVSPGVVWRNFYWLGLVRGWAPFFFFDCGKAHYKIYHLNHLKCTG